MSLPFTPDPSVKPDVTAFFDAPTNTISYVVKDPASASCAVIDSVMDIDYAAGRITHDGADKIIAWGVGPFIITDLIKLAIAAAIVPAVWGLIRGKGRNA